MPVLCIRLESQIAPRSTPQLLCASLVVEIAACLVKCPPPNALSSYIRLVLGFSRVYSS